MSQELLKNTYFKKSAADYNNKKKLNFGYT